MYTKFLLLLSLLITQNAIAQVTPRNLLGKKYNLAAVQQALIPLNKWTPYPKTAAAWQAAVPAEALEKMIKNGEKAIDYVYEPITASIALDFVRSGDRLRHEHVSFVKRDQLIQLILAESIEDKGRFTESIMNGIWSICEESYWGVPAHIGHTGLPDVENPSVDLFTGETAGVLALADYFIGEKLDRINPLIRKRIYFETNQRFFNPLLQHPERYSWMSKTEAVNNWNPWIMSNWILSALLIEKNETRRAEMIHASMLGLDLYLNGLGEDGGCDEGPMYWFAAGGSAFDCLELLQKSTNNTISIFSEPLIEKMASYVYKTHIAGAYFVNFADADPQLAPDGLMLYRFGEALHDEQMIQFGLWARQTYPDVKVTGFQRMRRVENLLTIKKMANQPVHYTPIADAWVNDIQVMTARAKNGFFLAAHGGHNNESHNHNDVGDFILYANGEPVIIDAGRGNYTARTFSSKRYELWFTQSQYHNLPIVNGLGQLVGRKYEAVQVKSTITEQAATLNLDIAPAYDQTAGIQTWNRSVSLNRVKNQLEINDDYVLAAKPSSLQQVFMTTCTIDLTPLGAVSLTTPKGQHFTLQYDPKLWTASVDVPSTEGMEYNSFKTKWGNQPVQRIVLTSKALNPKGNHGFVLK